MRRSQHVKEMKARAVKKLAGNMKRNCSQIACIMPLKISPRFYVCIQIHSKSLADNNFAVCLNESAREKNLFFLGSFRNIFAWYALRRAALMLMMMMSWVCVESEASCE
jgi:hypothetical protein